MAQSLIKNIIDDVKLTLSASSPSVEMPISDIRIDYWVRSARDELVADYLTSRMPFDNSVMMSYKQNLDTDALTPTTETVEGQVRGYVDLDMTLWRLLDIPFDKSIVDAYWHMSTTHARARVVSQSELWNINTMEFTAPTEGHPVIYGVRNTSSSTDVMRIYLVGPATGTIATGGLELWGVRASLPHDATVKQTSEIEHFSISPAHVKTVTDMAIEKGARELNIPHLINIVNEGIPINPYAHGR